MRARLCVPTVCDSNHAERCSAVGSPDHATAPLRVISVAPSGDTDINLGATTKVSRSRSTASVPNAMIIFRLLPVKSHHDLVLIFIYLEDDR